MQGVGFPIDSCEWMKGLFGESTKSPGEEGSVRTRYGATADDPFSRPSDFAEPVRVQCWSLLCHPWLPVLKSH